MKYELETKVSLDFLATRKLTWRLQQAWLLLLKSGEQETTCCGVVAEECDADCWVAFETVARSKKMAIVLIAEDPAYGGTCCLLVAGALALNTVRMEPVLR